MFLKSIELFGFKSFADRARIEFTDGISALLGPNGCGKSNVVDAIKWVLGEQATKSLRAERMEDVIFNGTENRKALSVAEVELVLANDEGLLPLDTPEISIRRRLFRSGDSEYYVNGNAVRLREVRELFFDTGIGKSAYSIMEQGKIDQILSTKPEERRLIFEEAAGITKYKARGREAERKLERTEENMRQVEGILKEVGRSYESLRKQAEKTLEYRRIRDESFFVERDVTLLRLKNHVEVRDRRQKQVEEKTIARDNLRTEIDRINENLEESLDVVNSMESKLIEHQKRLYGVELEKNNRENQIRIHKERIDELTQKIAGDENRRVAIEHRISQLRTEIEEIEASVAEYEARVADVAENIETFEQHVKHAGQRIDENKAEIERLENAIADAEGKQTEFENDLRELTDDIVHELDEALASSGYSRAQRDEKSAHLHQELDRLTRDVGSRNAQIHDAIAAGASETISELASEGFGELVDRIGTLRRLFSEYEQNIPSFLDDFLAPEGIITRKRELDTALLESRESVRRSRSQIAELNQENGTLSGRIQEYRGTLEDLRVNQVRMTTQVSAMKETASQRHSAVDEQERSMARHIEELETDKNRLATTNARIESLTEELRGIAQQEKELEKQQKDLEQEISQKNKNLADAERGIKTKMEQLGTTQAEVERTQVQLAETSAEIRNLYENFRERFSQELTEHESRMLEITASPSDLRSKLAELREQERQLGAVNLAAPEEFEEVKERYEFLSGQLEDLKQAREDLARVTEEIQSESAALFAKTYEQIKKNFHSLFRRLFGGGRAEIRLSEPDAMLESGVEIFVQPPGKKLENIALLSGGERSMTAVALLFATYMVRPSPFCLLDEIDAALDESNVGRFTSMLMEFAESSQFIIITHNKKTVAAARTLLGVTMEEHGVSKVIAIRIGGTEKVAAG
ncbi:MAG: chromosome segregation SMC family protein [Spirochaetales bacterium]